MNSKMLIRVVLILVAGAAVVAAAVMYKMGEKEDFGEEMREEAAALVLPAVDPASQEYVRGLIEWAHPTAYEGAFTEREGLTGGTVDTREYQKRLLEAIIERARADGQTGTVEALEKVKAGL